MKNTIFKVTLLSYIVLNSMVLHAQDKENIEKEWGIENCVNQFSFTDTVGTQVGYQYWFADKDFLDGQTLKMSAVAPHQATHAPHKHLEDEFFFVLEGEAYFILNGDSVKAKPYASFYCPSGVEHGIRNAGDTELKYLVIKKYLK